MKNFLLALSIGVALVMTSCLDIVEEITLEANGSGHYEMAMDMSEMMSMMMAYMPDSVKENMNEEDMMDSLASISNTREMDSVIEVLESIDGISNASNRMEGFVMKISYDFDDVESLNKAASQGSFTSKQGIRPAQFSWKKGQLVRTYSKLDLDNGDEEMEEAMGMAKMMMADATFTTIYHLPGKVKKYSNESAQLLDRKRTLKMEYSFGDVLDDPEAMSTEIRFKSK